MLALPFIDRSHACIACIGHMHPHRHPVLFCGLQCACRPVDTSGSAQAVCISCLQAYPCSISRHVLARVFDRGHEAEAFAVSMLFVCYKLALQAGAYVPSSLCTSAALAHLMYICRACRLPQFLGGGSSCPAHTYQQLTLLTPMQLFSWPIVRCALCNCATP